MKVAYTGISDAQEFGAEDFKKADLEQRKLRFPKGEPVEVDDAVGQALIAKDGIFGDFSFEEVTEDNEREIEELGDEEESDEEESDVLPDPPANSGKAATTEGTANADAGAGTAAGTAGRGSRGAAGRTGRGSSTP